MALELPKFITNRKAIALPSFLEKLDPKIFWSDNYVCLDFETTNRDKGSAVNGANRIVLATWVLGGAHRQSPLRLQSEEVGTKNGVNFKWGNEFEQGELVEAVRSADFIVAHFAKFELQWLVRAGCDISRILPWDTVLGEYVLAGNRRRALDLDSVSRRRKLGDGKEGLVASLIQGGICPSEIPEQWLVEYGCTDTWLAHEIFLQQRKELSASGLLPVMYTRCLTTPVLADIELNGLQLDISRVKEEYERTTLAHADAERKLIAITGGINLNSPKQVGEYLYDKLGFAELRKPSGEADRTPASGRRTDAESVSRLVATTEEQDVFTRIYGIFRPLDTKLAALEKMLACCNERGGLLYASINQAVTQTHRLSSSGKEYKLQIQNIDRSLKKVFRARNPGWLVGEADGSQLEFRVAAHLGRDQVALADIRNPKFDAHYQTGEILYKKPRGEISKDERTDAKPRTFKPLYGGMSGTKEEREYYRFFQEKYDGIYKAQEGWTYDVLRDKQLRTECGLIFYWPDTKLEATKGRKGYIKNRTSIFNYPVQSLATAEIIPIALVYFWHKAKALGLKLFLTNTVHDSIMCELPPEEEDVFRSLSEECFTVDTFRYLDRVYRLRFTVPLGTETKVGTHWSEGREKKYDLDPEEFFEHAA